MQKQVSNWLSLFPNTKLRPPRTQETIERNWLTDKLYQLTVAHRLILISAPAGSGKTTLVADLSRRSSQITVRWLSLDEGDNNLQAFLPAIAIALLPEIDHELIHNINSGHVPTRQVANILVNWLDQFPQQSVALVLDDLHLVTEKQVYDFLDYLIENLPANVHIIAMTRYDPPLSLSKMRGRGELAELRLDELRFSPEEATHYLNHLLNLELPEHLVRQLCQRTEGWIAGLRLLALSLTYIEANKRAQYIDELAQNNRYVFELLAQEVLAQQNEEIRRFLLETSVLSVLTPEICQFITQQSDVATILYHLHRHNLFLVALGDGTYRYHTLFQDFLQNQLKLENPDQYKKIHKQAATIHSQNMQAFQHYIAAEAWNDAIGVMRQAITRDVMNCITLLIDMRQELFVNQLPQQLQNHNPWVLLVRGSLAVDRGLYLTGIPLIETARDLFQKNDELDGEILADIQLLTPQLERTDNGEVYPLFCAHVHHLVPDITPEIQFMTLLAGIRNSACNYRHHKVEQFLLKMIDDLIRQDNVDTYRRFAQCIGHVLFFTSQGLKPFERILPYMEKHTDREKSIIRMGVCNIQSTLALFRGEPDIAKAFAQESQAIIQFYGGFAWAEAVVDAVILSVALIHEDYEEFDHYHDSRLPEIMRVYTSRQYLTEWLYLSGRRLLAENHLEEAQRVCEQMKEHCVFKEFEGLALALQAHIALHQEELSKAEQLMKQAVYIRAETNRFFPTNGHLCLAQIQWQMGEFNLALQTLHKALSPLVAWGMPGLVLIEGKYLLPVLEAGVQANIFPEFLSFCINAMRGDHTSSRPLLIPGSSDYLTPREVDILRLIVIGDSNRDIAESLFITENTVKSHITRILSKLHAKSRTEAAARVRELHLHL